jgi:hypothetical protein
VSGLGTLAMLPKGLGRPVDVRQLISASFSLIYLSLLSFISYDTEFRLSLIDLLFDQSVLIPISFINCYILKYTYR